jgi:hypothetical protein
MSIRTGVSAAVMLLMYGLIGHAEATTFFTFTFDENGNASYQTYNPITMAYNPVMTETGTLVSDLTNSPTGEALQYLLPGNVSSGFVLVADSPATTCSTSPTVTCSDILEFIQGPTGGQASMNYYSLDTTGEQLADTGFNPQMLNPIATVTEDLDGSFSYSASADSPSNISNTDYWHAVPLPRMPALATIVLLGVAVLVLERGPWKRRTAGIKQTQ